MRRRRRWLGAMAVLIACSTACGSASVAPTSSASSSGAPATSVRPPTTATSTTAATSTTTSSTTTSVAPTLAPAPSVTIPVGAGGISYRAGGPDLEALGPSLVAVTDDGVAHIFDPVDRRLVHASAGGLEFTDLVELDILSITAMTADGLDLILVEVFFGPERHRVHRLNAARDVVASIDLPPGFRLENGLSGILPDRGAGFVIEFGGGEQYGRYDADLDSFTIGGSTTIRDVDIQPRPPNLVVDGVLLSADLAGEFGSLRYLGTDVIGRHIVERTDVLATSPIVVLRTVEWHTADGRFLMSALVPSIEDQAIDQSPGLAVTAGGDVIVLIALEDMVIIRALDTVTDRITE